MIIKRIIEWWRRILEEEQLKRQEICHREGHKIRKQVRMRYDFSGGDGEVYEEREVRRKCSRCKWKGGWHRISGSESIISLIYYSFLSSKDTSLY